MDELGSLGIQATTTVGKGKDVVSPPQAPEDIILPSICLL